MLDIGGMCLLVQYVSYKMSFKVERKKERKKE